jgi:glycolate oxidase
MSTLAMPKIDQSVLNDKESIVRDLKKFTNSINIISDPEGITPYETDALSAYKQKPMAVVLPENTAEVIKIMLRLFQEDLAQVFLVEHCL